MDKKHILVFGDSNTWGYNPHNRNPFAPYERWGESIRWTNVMQNLLGSGYSVMADGLCGRTASAKDDIEDYTCGKEQIIPSMRSHSPLDLLIIMLGSNDLKARYGYTAFDVANSVGMVVEKALQAPDAFRNSKPNILLLCPPPLENLDRSFFAFEFAGSEQKSKDMAQFYEIMAAKYRVHYLNTGDIVRFSDVDGLHFESDQHLKLAEAVTNKVKEIL